MSKFKNGFKNLKKSDQIILGIWFILSIIFFYSFIYNDILETMRVGISFWEELFQGEVRYFYGQKWELTSFAYQKQVQAVYDFPIYIVFALWNFPIWLVEHFTGIDVMNSALCLMWGKTLILISVFLITNSIYKLCKTLDVSEKMCFVACLLFLSSNFFTTSIVMMTAYDIIALYFAIEGANYYFKGSNRGFILCFMCAIPLKFFALLLFVPLLLLKEKRIPHIIGKCFLGIAPILIFRLLLPCQAVVGDPSTVAFNLTNMLKSTNLSNLAWIYAVYHRIPISIGEIYPAIVLWIMLLILCYVVKIDSQEKLNQWGIYVCFAAYAILFVFCMSHPYWILIMIPFVVVMMVQNMKGFYFNLILETGFTWGMILASIFRFPWCFGNGLVSGMFWPLLLGKQSVFKSVTPVSILTEFGISENGFGYFIGIGNTVFVACIFLFAIFNFPTLKNKISTYDFKEADSRFIFYLRILAGIVIALIPMVMYIIGT